MTKTAFCHSPSKSDSSAEKRPSLLDFARLQRRGSKDATAGATEQSSPSDGWNPHEAAHNPAGRSFHQMYEKHEVLGKGTSGVVYAVTPRRAAVPSNDGEGPPTERFACKEMSIAVDAKSGRGLMKAKKELEVMKSLRHPNIIELCDFFLEDNCCRMIMPLLTGGELSTSLADLGSLAEDDAKAVMTSVLRGIEYMHSKNIAHRDLKLENIVLVDQRSTYSDVKIVDLGMAKKLAELSADGDYTEQHTCCGSPLYIAPEVSTPVSRTNDGRPTSHYGVEADIWSCGIMLYMILSGHPPFDLKGGIYKLFKQIRNGDYSLCDDPVWELISEEGKDMVRTMLTIDPATRPSAAEALKHPWLQAA